MGKGKSVFTPRQKQIYKQVMETYAKAVDESFADNEFVSKSCVNELKSMLTVLGGVKNFTLEGFMEASNAMSKSQKNFLKEAGASPIVAAGQMQLVAKKDLESQQTNLKLSPSKVEELSNRRQLSGMGDLSDGEYRFVATTFIAQLFERLLEAVVAASNANNK